MKISSGLLISIFSLATYYSTVLAEPKRDTFVLGDGTLVSSALVRRVLYSFDHLSSFDRLGKTSYTTGLMGLIKGSSKVPMKDLEVFHGFGLLEPRNSLKGFYDRLHKNAFPILANLVSPAEDGNRYTVNYKKLPDFFAKPGKSIIADEKEMQAYVSDILFIVEEIADQISPDVTPYFEIDFYGSSLEANGALQFLVNVARDHNIEIKTAFGTFQVGYYYPKVKGDKRWDKDNFETVRKEFDLRPLTDLYDRVEHAQRFYNLGAQKWMYIDTYNVGKVRQRQFPLARRSTLGLELKNSTAVAKNLEALWKKWKPENVVKDSENSSRFIIKSMGSD